MGGTQKRIILLVLLIAAIAALRLSPAGRILSFGMIKRNLEMLAAFVQHNYLLSVVSYIGVYIVATSLSMPGVVVLTLAGGYLFGTVASTVYVDIGATTGAVLAFLWARYLLGKRLQEKYEKQLKRFNAEIALNGTNYLLTVRLIPIVPFFLINFLAGLTRIPLRTFLWTTSFGIIPGTAVFAFAGRQIGLINSPSDILSKKIILAFAILAVFTLVPAIVKRVRRAKQASDR